MAKARVRSIVSSLRTAGDTITVTCVLFHWSDPKKSFRGVFKFKRGTVDYWFPRVGDTVQHYGNKISRVTSRAVENSDKRKENEVSKLGKMSEDRVRFFLHYRYFVKGINSVLTDAFGLEGVRWARIRCDNNHGFWIICRPSQFARFLIYRDAAGITNGFKDLNAELRDVSKPVSLAEGIAQDRGMAAHVIAEILIAGGVDPYKNYDDSSCQGEIEVWSNSHTPK